MEQKIVSYIKKCVCATCLSRDRTLILANDVDQLKDVFPDLKFGQDDMICWECKALTMKMVGFKRRACMAQDMFLEICKEKVVLNDIVKFKSLSQLTKLDTDIISYNDFVKEEISPNFNIDNPIKVEFELDLKHEPTSSNSSTVSVDPVEESEREKEVFAELQEEVASNCPEVEINRRENDKNSTSLLKADKSEGYSKIVHLTDFDVKTGKCYNSFIKMIMLTETELEKIRNKKAKFQKSSFKCSSCVETFKDGAALDAHNIKHSDTSGMFSCRICKQRMLTQKELEDHTVLHFRCFECQVCQYKSLEFDVALKHYDFSHHTQSLECKSCSQTFQTVKELQVHKRTHKSAQNCPECGKTYKHADSLKAHITFVHKDRKMKECPICQRKIRGGTTHLQKHIATHDDKVDEAAFCADCCVQFKNVDLYKNHLKTTLKHLSPEDLKFKCQHCEKRFVNAAALRSHTMIHTNEAKFQCHICNKPFKKAKRMREHINIKHEGKVKPKDKVCDICGKAFNNKATLQQHLNSHLGHRPYVCDICSDSFCFSGAFYTHKKLKHGIKSAKKK